MSLKMADETIAILENKKINAKYYKLVFSSIALSQKVQPGQFLQIRINAGHDPFLRRPFSYYRIKNKCVEVLYEVLGFGTDLLSKKKKGDQLQVMGPLGKGFSPVADGKKRLLVAGGIGLPPLVFLGEKNPIEYFLIGTKSKLEIMPERELKKIKGKVLYSTEDGSYGTKGMVTVLLEKIFKQENPRDFFIQTCGPKRMMAAVIALAKKYRIQGEASWDEAMACGVGACLGCMVQTRNGLQRACVDGPVFKFGELVL